MGDTDPTTSRRSVESGPAVSAKADTDAQRPVQDARTAVASRDSVARTRRRAVPARSIPHRLPPADSTNCDCETAVSAPGVVSPVSRCRCALAIACIQSPTVSGLPQAARRCA